MAEFKYSKEAQAKVDELIAKIRKTHGATSVMWLNDKAVQQVEVLPTGVAALDRALGVGGYPKGRIVEAFGSEGSGKTTLALHAIAEAQRAGGIAALIDLEHALDPTYAAALGVDVGHLLLSQPDDAESALNLMDAMVESDGFAIVVLDSVAALAPKAELQGEVGESHVGLQARMMSQLMRRLAAKAYNTKTVAFFINQVRDNIGTMGYGPTTTTPGGRALKHAASIRIDLRVVQQIKEGDERIGSTVKAKIVKNKVSCPYTEAEMDMIFGQGIAKERNLLNEAVAQGVVAKKGSWLSFGEVQLGQGLSASADHLREDKKLCGEIEKALRAA